MGSLIDSLRGSNPVLFWTGAANLGLVPLLLLLHALDPRLVAGAPVWFKPLKFCLSVGIYCWTISVMLRAVEAPAAARWIGSGTSLCLSGEIVLILMQAARGVKSHFNVTTPFDGAVFGLMGVLIGINSILALWLTVLTFTRPAAIHPLLLAGVRWGLIVSFAGVLVGAVMPPRLQHSVGVPDGGPGLPFLNWSREGGDLRVAHFAGLHALQALPLLAWLLLRTATPRGEWLLALAGAAWLGFTILLFLQAIARKPLWP